MNVSGLYAQYTQGLPSWLASPYVGAGIILVGSAIIAFVFLFFLARYIELLTRKTKTHADDLLFDRLKKPVFFLILIYGFKWSLELLIGQSLLADRLIGSVLVVFFVTIISRVLNTILETWGETFAKKTETRADEVLLPLFTKIVNALFVLVGALWILQVWSIDITPYLAGVGISGIVIGLALQDLLKNVLGGISLLLDDTFQVGDKIKLESGEIGTIHDIGLRSTKLVTYDNEVIYVPNGYLANSRLQNYTRPDPVVRSNIEFGVAYGTDVAKVQKVVLGVLKKHKRVLDDPEPGVHFMTMADSSLNFTARFWVSRWDESYGIKLELNEAIYNALNKQGIDIPFPTRTVYLKKE